MKKEWMVYFKWITGKNHIYDCELFGEKAFAEKEEIFVEKKFCFFN